MAQAIARKQQDDRVECPNSNASHGTFCWNELMTR